MLFLVRAQLARLPWQDIWFDPSTGLGGRQQAARCPLKAHTQKVGLVWPIALSKPGRQTDMGDTWLLCYWTAPRDRSQANDLLVLLAQVARNVALLARSFAAYVPGRSATMGFLWTVGEDNGTL